VRAMLILEGRVGLAENVGGDDQAAIAAFLAWLSTSRLP
jgi:hypothetical protein